MVEIDQLRKEKAELLHSYEELEQQMKAKEVHACMQQQQPMSHPKGATSWAPGSAQFRHICYDNISTILLCSLFVIVAIA